ncbi:MAG: oxidoreductase family protein [Dehalococcoidia bacterium]
MAHEFPTTADAITNEWLSSVLGAEVTGFTTTFLEGGVLADAFKLHSITYKGNPADAPSSVVVKVPNAVKERREMAIANNAYVKELFFFRDLAEHVPVRSPKLYGCFTDGSHTCASFIIVMEDLSTHSKVFDQVDDTPDVACARQVALEAAAMHAKFWESDTTRLPWIGRADGRYVFAFDGASRMANAAWPEFLRLWHQMYGRDFFHSEPDGDLEELAVMLTGPKCGGIIDRIYDVLSSRPKTLLHGDLRADNIFRTHPERGKSAEESTLTFIDWQAVHAGPPGPEFAQAFFNSLEPEVRRHDRDILREYHARLVTLNPDAASYTYDMLIEDYALSMCFWWTAIVTIGAGTLPIFDRPEGARMKRLWEKGAVRAKAAMRELDCLSRVRRLAEGLPDDPPVT